MSISTRQAYSIALVFSSVLAWFSFLSIVFFTNPAGAGTFGVVILYVSFGVGMGSFGLIIWQFMNRKKN